MTSELLDRVHAEIRERRDERRPAVEEYERLEAALAALEGVLSSDSPRVEAPAPAAEAKPRAARRPRAKPAARAPRGANREAVLRAASEHPGATAGELAAASGVSRPVVYNLVKTLSERGELVKRGTGYALPSTPEPVTAAPVAPEPPAASPVPSPAPEPAAATPEPAEPIKTEPPAFGLPRPTESGE